MARKPRANGQNGQAEAAARLPPQDTLSEKALLGSVLLDPPTFDEVSLLVKREDFYLSSHQQIFEIVSALMAKGRPIDPVMIGDRLKAAGLLEECGGYDYLQELLEAVPHSAHARHYARIVQHKAIRRKLMLASTDALHDVYDETLEIGDVVARCEERLFGALERQAEVQEVSIRDVLVEALHRLDEKREPGIPTGFQLLDDIVLGMPPGALWIVAARPSIGKTSFAGNIAVSVARAGHAVGFITVEQPNIELTDRMLSSESGVDYSRMRKHDLDAAECDAIQRAAERLGEHKLWLNDTTRPMSAVEASIRLMRRKHKIAVAFVDYLQLVNPDERSERREQEVAEISRRLKLLAKGTGIPIVCLSQLSRDVEKRGDRPRLSDLRESGSIEQDADVVMFLHRPEFADADDRAGECDVIVAKHRNGKTGTVTLAFQKETMTFRDPPRQLAQMGNLF